MPTAFQPVPETVEIKTQFTQNGQKVENIFYANAGQAITAAIVEELATMVGVWVVNTFLAHVSSNVVYNRTVATDISTEASFQTIDSTGAGTTGGGGPSTLPNNATIAVHRDTGLSGKKAKSRIYIAGIVPGGLSDPNTVSTAYAASLVADLNALDTALADDGTVAYDTGYVQRVINGVRLATGNFIPTIGWSMVDRLVDSQRRRLAGRGQ